jgi:hypothetical protein
MRFTRRLRSLSAIAITTVALSGGAYGLSPAPAGAQPMCSSAYIGEHETIREHFWRYAEEDETWAEISYSFGDWPEYFRYSELAEYWWGMQERERELLEACGVYG